LAENAERLHRAQDHRGAFDRLPVVVVTSACTPEFKEKALAAGATMCWTSPRPSRRVFPTQPLTAKGALLLSRLVFRGPAAKAIQHDLIYAQDT